MSWIWEDFVRSYLQEYLLTNLTVLDVGGPSEIRRVFSNEGKWEYNTVNIHDQATFVIRDNPYDWFQIETNSMDVVVSTDTFEHVPYFWMTLFEIARVLKNRGLAFIHAPSATPEHPGNLPAGYRDGKYFDCWRMYADGLSSLCKHVGFIEVEVFTEWGLDRFQNSYLVMQKPDLNNEQLQLLVTRGWHQKMALATDVAIGKDIPRVSFDYDLHTSRISFQKNQEVIFKKYERAGQFGKLDPYYYLKLGRMHVWRNNTGAAIDCFKTAIQQLENGVSPILYKNYLDTAFDVNLHNLYSNLGMAQYRHGDVKEAVESLKKVIRLKPNFFEGPYNLVRLYMESGEFDSALLYCENLIKISPSHGYRLMEDIRTLRQRPIST